MLISSVMKKSQLDWKDTTSTIQKGQKTEGSWKGSTATDNYIDDDEDNGDDDDDGENGDNDDDGDDDGDGDGDARVSGDNNNGNTKDAIVNISGLFIQACLYRSNRINGAVAASCPL